MRSPWTIRQGVGPVIATAIHHGHDLRPELRPYIALSDRERRREEDAFTGRWTAVAPTQVIVRRSRFEVDLNRSRQEAVYVEPEDAWGLQVWNQRLPESVIHDSLNLHDQFYEMMYTLLLQRIERHGFAIVLDIHDYNHRRKGPYAPADSPKANPELNVGTGTMPRERWAPVVDRFLQALRRTTNLGRPLDARENVRFRGGYFPRWIHETFPEQACALAVEVKKFFMDEWTGRANREAIEAVQNVLHAAAAELSDIPSEALRLPALAASHNRSSGAYGRSLSKSK